jgi:transcriptional regulator with XRE-family HTH domain
MGTGADFNLECLAGSVGSDRIRLLRGAVNLSAIDCHVGARARVRRIELGISEYDAAKALGRSVDHLRDCETGKVHISAAFLFEISRLLDVEINYFFHGVSVGIDGASTDAKARREHP